VVASTLYYDKKTPKSARPSDEPSPPQKVQSQFFGVKNRFCEHSNNKPIFGCFAFRVLKVSGAKVKMDIFPGLRQEKRICEHTCNTGG
jgi:hypothetical protein